MSAATMNAVVFHRYGDADVLQTAQVPVPSIGARDVLVRVHAAAVNPVDCKIRHGAQRILVRPRLPATPGMDLSGTVEQIGAGVTEFAVGDAVFSSPSHRRMGAYAQFASVHADELAHKPQSLDHEQAASLPLVALTAWDALVLRGKLRAGQRVLIQAGAGGVGNVAIQLAKHLGAEVLTTCSEKNADFVRSLGADRVINYHEEDYAEVAAGVDLIVDAIGPKDVVRAVQTVRRGGRVIALATGLPEATDAHGPLLGTLAAIGRLATIIVSARVRRNVRVIPMARIPSGKNLTAIASLVDAGKIRPVVERVLSLDEAADAHRRVETGRCRGKVVLRVPA
jgi:NADPH:quinone reductase-like Zn-dependent oxidoreductase